MSAFAGQKPHSEPLLAGADSAAAAALRELPDALVVVFDTDLRFVLTAGQAIARMGDPDVACAGQHVGDALPGELWGSLEPLFRSALDGETRSREIWSEGKRHCLMVDVGPLPGADGAPEHAVAGGVAVILDVTARRQADMLAVAQPESGFEQVFERAPIGTGLLDRDGRWLLVNRALCEITGYTAEELIGKRFDGIVHPADVGGEDTRQRERLLAGEIPAFQSEKRYFDAAGETVSAIVSMSLVRDRDGEPLHFIAQLQDISDRKHLEEQLRRLADHDALTGLRNGRLFEHDLRLQIARCRRYGEVAGLLLVDLDEFRQVNETYSHTVGDETLRAVARALTRRLRETDLVARLGGDEFAVLLPHIDEEGLRVVADGLARVIPACGVDLGSSVLHPRASVGHALIDQHSGSVEAVLAEARASVRAAKRPRADASA